MATPRHIAAAVSVALVLAACTGSPKPPGSALGASSAALVAPPPAGFRDIGAGFAIDDTSHVATSVTAAAVADGAAANVARVGLPSWPTASRLFDATAKTEPASPTRIAVPLMATPTNGQSVIVMTRATPDSDWEPLPTIVTSDGRHAIATTTHFSAFTALFAPVKEMVAQFKDIVEQALSGAVSEAKAPTCTQQDSAKAGGWSAKRTGSDALLWCFGMKSGTRVITVVNQRRYPLIIAHPGAVKVYGGDDLITRLVSDRAPGYRKLTLLEPRTSVTYTVAGNAQLSSTYDGLAQSVYALVIAGDALTTIIPSLPGKKYATGYNLATAALHSSKCVNEVVSGDIAAMIPACLTSEVLTAAYGVWGALAGVLMSTVAVLEFFRSSVNAFGDQFHGRDQSTVRITAPALSNGLLRGPTSVTVTYDAEFWVADGANRVAACQISSGVAECLYYAGNIKPPSGVCPTRSPYVVGAAISGPHSGWWCHGGHAEGALILGVVSTPSTAWHTGRDWPTLTGTFGEDAGDKAVLPSGASISRGSITCSVAGTSVRCRNSSNGVWFFLAPSGLTTDGKVTVGQVTYSH